MCPEHQGWVLGYQPNKSIWTAPRFPTDMVKDKLRVEYIRKLSTSGQVAGNGYRCLMQLCGVDDDQELPYMTLQLFCTSVPNKDIKCAMGGENVLALVLLDPECGEGGKGLKLLNDKKDLQDRPETSQLYCQVWQAMVKWVSQELWPRQDNDIINTSGNGVSTHDHEGTNAAGDATVPGGDLDVNTYNQQGESAQLQALEGVQAMAGQGVEQGRIQPTSMVTLGKSIPNTDRAAGADEAGPSTPDPNARCTPVPRQGKRALNAAVAADASADKRIATGKATKRAGDGGIASGAGDDEQVLVCVPTLPVSSSPLQHVGKRYWLWWRGDKKWYAGQITKYDPTKGQRGQGLHHMTYDDGETEWLDMRKETKCPCNPGDAEPPPPPPTPVRAAAAVRRQPDTTAGAGGSPGSSNQPDSKGKSSSVKPASEDAMMKLIRKQRTNLTQLCSYWQQAKGATSTPHMHAAQVKKVLRTIDRIEQDAKDMTTKAKQQLQQAGMDST
eukprot:jgi/Chrzof1/4130/Cz14g00080.t1